MYKNNVTLRIKILWRLFGLTVAILGLVAIYDRFLKYETSLKSSIINIIIGMFLIVISVINNYIEIQINENELKTVCLNNFINKIFRMKSYKILFKKVTSISPTITPTWFPVKHVMIEGIGDNGKEVKILISNFHTNFKEALIYIKNHVPDSVIEESLLELINRYEVRQMK